MFFFFFNDEEELALENKDIIIYQTEDTNITTQVIFKDETFWMPQKEIAELFGVDRSTIGRHLQNIFRTGELKEEVVCAKFAHTTKCGVINKSAAVSILETTANMTYN